MSGGRHTVVIADDEPLARRRLRQLLATVDDFRIVDEADHGAATVEVVRATRPDVLFLDVQMPGLDGFGVIDSLGAPVPFIIFVTAFAQHAPRAFDVDAIDYLVKPVIRDRFARAIEKARRALGREVTSAGHGASTQPASARRPGTPTSRILVAGPRRDVIVDTADIDWLSAEGAYVNVHARGRAFVLRDALGSLLLRLDSTQFVRVHRSAAVNVDRVRATRRAADGRLHVVLDTGVSVEVSRRRATSVLKRLGRIRRG